MLEIIDLKAGYNGADVLYGVDLSVGAKEIVALIGPNGAGKSTILKSIFGLADIYGGKIVYKDIDITNLKTHELISLGISFVPQGRQIFSNMTVWENLEMGAFVIKDKVVIKKELEKVLTKFPMLKDKKTEMAANLSGGQQQILAIARALIQNPQVILMDEPSLGLDPKTMKEVFDKIIEIKNEGISILMVEQNAKQAVAIADRTYVLESGTIALQGGKEILRNKKIKNVYFGGEIR